MLEVKKCRLDLDALDTFKCNCNVRMRQLIRLPAHLDFGHRDECAISVVAFLVLTADYDVNQKCCTVVRKILRNNSRRLLPCNPCFNSSHIHGWSTRHATFSSSREVKLKTIR